MSYCHAGAESTDFLSIIRGAASQQMSHPHQAAPTPSPSLTCSQSDHYSGQFQRMSFFCVTTLMPPNCHQDKSKPFLMARRDCHELLVRELKKMLCFSFQQEGFMNGIRSPC